MNNIEVSVVIPCLNEEKSIGLCVNKIKEVFSAQNISGEIIVVDNGSTDRSAQIAADGGAKVVNEPVKGYGSAYITGLKNAVGQYIIMADGDNTYDFGEIPAFLEILKGGKEMVMGSRFKGKIHRGAMPWLNRYVGNPVLSGLCRLFFGTQLSDIHCGMRAMSREGYKKLNLQCLGMEFATEMVMEALQRRLNVGEVAIQYYPREGDSKLRPFEDGWRHLRFMLLFCPTWLYLLPGAAMLIVGLLAMLVLVGGPVRFLGRTWGMHVMIFGSLLSLVGYQVINLGVYARTFAVKQDYLKKDRPMSFILNNFHLETGIIIGLVVFSTGLAINVGIFWEWWSNSFGSLYRIRESILAMTLMVLGMQTFFSSFFISLLLIKR